MGCSIVINQQLSSPVPDQVVPEAKMKNLKRVEAVGKGFEEQVIIF